MKLLIDMNLSPEWVDVLASKGVDAVHWSKIGSPTAPDKEIMEWAKSNSHIVLTHDLDFGAILAATEAEAPSVIQLRFQDIAPDRSLQLVLDVIARFQNELEAGVLISVDESRTRIRLLPLR
ncbi:MAG: hypothetical protein C4560_13050 [Nitrospiraceae bacterium]|nr:MAG: hypothetical protein C4560_13050 [Nitrospiraceae bacterium]